MGKRKLVEAAYYEHAGNASAMSRALGMPRSTVRYHIHHLGLAGSKPLAAGALKGITAKKRQLPKKGQIKRYLMTSAQNNTWVHEQLWENMQALSKHYGAEILVASYSYDIASYGKMAVKRGKEKGGNELWYDPKIEGFLDHSDQRMELAPGLMWCGEVNILPTAARPLTGFETYTGRASGIFPHAKIAMQSIPSAKNDPTKFNYTTGTVTKCNYIQKKAGLVAEHHHAYACVIAEVNSDGDWWVRQVIADEDGVMYDLDVKVEDGKVETGQTVEAITWGDYHAASVDPTVREAAWGLDGMMDTLRPRVQVHHDLDDFRFRNHHDRGNGLKMFKKHMDGCESVELEHDLTLQELQFTLRNWCETVVVCSNHDRAFDRWLDEANYRSDPVNALYFLKAELARYEAAAAGVEWNCLAWAMQNAGLAEGVVKFLNRDESYMILGIENGMHGDDGPNGARGTPRNLSRLGHRSNTAHTHTAGIIDGNYTAGTSSLLDMQFNVGPSAWSHSHIVTYPNGKRAIITMWKGKWRA